MISEVVLEVCEYYSQCMSTHDIAEMMHMSEEYVKDILDEYFEEFMDGGEKYET